MHTAHMEVINQEIVLQIIAVLFAPLALIVAAAFGVALVTGVAGRVVLFVEDLANHGDASHNCAVAALELSFATKIVLFVVAAKIDHCISAFFCNPVLETEHGREKGPLTVKFI